MIPVAPLVVSTAPSTAVRPFSFGEWPASPSPSFQKSIPPTMLCANQKERCHGWSSSSPGVFFIGKSRVSGVPSGARTG
jgi:hypothetical protein